MLLRNESGKKMVIIIAALGVVLLAGICVMGMKVMGGKGKGKAAAHKQEKPKETHRMPLGAFVVNLADTGEMRYLKADVVLEIEGAEKKAGGHGGGGEETDPRLRDAIIEVLSSRRFNELVTPEGKEKLKKDILAAVNEDSHGDKAADKEAHAGKAVDVYFNEFAMQ